MHRFTTWTLGSALLFVAAAVAWGPSLRGPHPAGAQPWIAEHMADTLSADSANSLIVYTCRRCHGNTEQRGNMSLAEFDVSDIQANGELAERMVRKLRAGMMPPAGARRPDDATLLAFTLALESRLDAAAAADPDPGQRAFQRLNQAEYRASVETLLGLDVDVGAFLPLDTKSANFDNIADAQLPSATLIEGYLRAADHVARIAVGDPRAEPASTSYKTARTASQLEHVEGAPIGTRGGLAAVHNFPADGEYEFQIILHPAPEGELYGRTLPNERIEVSIDGERVAILEIDRWMSESDPAGMQITTGSIHVRAGPHRVATAFIRQFEGSVDDLVTPVEHTLADTQIGLGYGVTTLPHLRELSIVGPFTVTGVSDTPSRRTIFSCRPTAPDEERPCAEAIVTRLASRAYRRPVNASDVEGLLGFYDQGAALGGFEVGIRTALQAILASPHFVFRIEEAEPVTDDTYRISDADLASRLSFFLWGAPPDDALIEAAANGVLSSPEQLRDQVERMLDDPRADALATRFAAQWLRLQDLEKVHPDALTYPYFDQTLAEAMARETELLFAHIVREDRPILELITADYTFVNERLARHYEIPNVTGSHFRRVAYPDHRRRGVLGHGSILTLTSHANRTSPVLRGKWVMEVLLGSPPPPPPPDVPDLEATNGANDGRLLTVRERMEEHRSNPACMSCHRVIDPIGLALENFDVTGAWRIKDEGSPVDPVGDLYDGTRIEGPDDLRAALLRRPEVFLRTFTENLMAYAIGRRVEYYDMPTVRTITRAAAANEYRLSAFVLGVVESPAFQLTRREAVAEDEPGSTGSAGSD